jgi:transposase
MEFCEWGYNRDGEDLKQVNICMLFGEDSKLPVYQTLYSGSLGDVSTLKTTISEFAALTGDAEITVVMDKGFFSAKNVNMLLSSGDGKHFCRFLMSVPFSNKFAKERVEAERIDIDKIENVVLTNGAPVRGVCKPFDWGGGVQLNTHVFFNPEKAAKDRNELFGYVASLARQAAADPHNAILDSEYGRYLKFHCARSNSKNTEISIREDVVAKELETTGWFVLLSNHIEDPQVAHDIYRTKDVVEKSFLRYKNNLGLNRLRVHSDDRMQNKLFVAFIALVIASAIHETMKRKGMYKQMTFDRLILTLAKLKSASVSGRAILRPMTKEQIDIFESFGVRLPDYDTLKPSVPKKRGRKPKPPAANNIG